MVQTSRRGFTLIELLVVIAIIGILSSIVLASLNSARKKGRDARRVADIKQLQLALELYYDANGAYPATLSSALTTGGFISTIPTDPSGGSYAYAGLSSTSGGSCSSYHLGANLETSGHSAFSSDSDAAASANTCAGSDADFNAVDTGSCAASQVAGKYCFDVKP